VPAAVGPGPGARARPLWWVVSSWRGGRGPQEAGKLPGHRDGCDVSRLAALAQPPADSVKARLGAPGDLQDLVGLAGLAVGQRRAYPRFPRVVVAGLDQQPTSDPRAGLGDRACAADSPDCSREGVKPSQLESLRGKEKRRQSPPSSSCSIRAVNRG
jgi:hypothetical protein